MEPLTDPTPTNLILPVCGFIGEPVTVNMPPGEVCGPPVSRVMFRGTEPPKPSKLYPKFNITGNDIAPLPRANEPGENGDISISGVTVSVPSVVGMVKGVKAGEPVMVTIDRGSVLKKNPIVTLSEPPPKILPGVLLTERAIVQVSVAVRGKSRGQFFCIQASSAACAASHSRPTAVMYEAMPMTRPAGRSRAH